MFIALVDVGGNAVAVQVGDIRMVADEAPDADGGVRRATLTLRDGSQVTAVGDVAGILKQLHKLETTK